MAGKRQATTDLNHDNWDREEEPEERGSFRTATEEELKNRVIKKAKRKVAPGASSDTADSSTAKNIFSSFTGFGTTSAAPATSASQFSFLNKIPAVGANTVSSNATTVAPFSFGIGSAVTASSKDIESSKPSISLGTTNIASSAGKLCTTQSESSELAEYYRNLSSLNQAVCEWIKTHVEKNPVCILSPIFKDYEKHLDKIENEKRDVKQRTHVKTADVEKKSESTVENCKLSTGSTSKTAETGANINTNGFSFGFKKKEDISQVKPSVSGSFNFSSNASATLSTAATSATNSSSSFSFGNHTNSSGEQANPSKTFSFTTGSTPFTFANVKPPEDVSGGDTNEEADEEPPKNEFKQVVEDDAVYSKKCKVFVKKDGNFVDKGVGTLYLKPIESSAKIQLLVRADTNLGNILVNLILNSSIPAKRMGKNNVMLICLPTPDVEKPTSMLLRVKTSEEADELLENIEKYRN